MINKFLNLIIVGEWEIYHRKNFIISVAEKCNGWSDIVIIHNPLQLVFHTLLKFKKRLLPHLKGKFKPKTVENGITMFTPIMFFSYFLWIKFPLLGFIDANLINFQVKYFLEKKFKGKKIIFWVNNPYLFKLTKILKHDYLIYDSFDDNDLNYDGSVNKKNREYNRKLIQKADLNICLSHYTYKKFVNYSNKVIYVPNANRYSSYKKNSAVLKAKEFEFINKPIIGYLGNIRNWIDFKLLKYLLKDQDDYLLVLIGGIMRKSILDVMKLKKNTNFLHIGFRSINTIPQYLQFFKVGIIPFVVNDFTRSVFPNKFYEYLAAEVPVVTTALPELEVYSEHIGYAHTYEEFKKYCLQAINGEFQNKILHYKNIASSNDWSARAEVLNSKLLELTEQNQI